MSADDRFAAMVEWARAHIRRGMVDAPSQSPQQHAALMLLQPTFEIDVAAHIRFATTDAWHFKVVVNAAVECLRAGKPMPEVLAEFAADVLGGIRKCPSAQGKHPRKPGRLDPMAVSVLVQWVHNRFDIARHISDDYDRVTAAKVVAEALAQEGRKATHGTIGQWCKCNNF